MRRAIVVFVVVAVSAMVASPASAIPAPKGCPSESSRWTTVYHPNDPETDWEETSFWRWYSQLPGVLDVWYDLGYTDEEIYFAFTFDLVDRNDDDVVCAWHIGGTAVGMHDDYISVVDNNSNATASS